jgi:hypothetical protein
VRNQQNTRFWGCVFYESKHEVFTAMMIQVVIWYVICAVMWRNTNVSEGHAASIFRVKNNLDKGKVKGKKW